MKSVFFAKDLCRIVKNAYTDASFQNCFVFFFFEDTDDVAQ